MKSIYFLSSTERLKITEILGLNHVPIIGSVRLNDIKCMGMSDVDALLQYAEGNSFLNPNTIREGVVYKCVTDGSFTFKAISNRWLMKKGE